MKQKKGFITSISTLLPKCLKFKVKTISDEVIRTCTSIATLGSIGVVVGSYIHQFPFINSTLMTKLMTIYPFVGGGLSILISAPIYLVQRAIPKYDGKLGFFYKLFFMLGLILLMYGTIAIPFVFFIFKI